MAYIPYWEKLKDPRWQRRRLEVMERDGFKCRDCSDTQTTLNVHHCYYKRGVDPWDYDDSALLTLCEPCHQRRHDIKEQMEFTLSLVSRDQIEAVVGFAKYLHAFNYNTVTELRSYFEIVGAGFYQQYRDEPLMRACVKVGPTATTSDVDKAAKQFKKAIKEQQRRDGVASYT